MKLAIIAPTAIPSRRANTVQVMKMTQAFKFLGHDTRLIVPDENVLDVDLERNWDELAHHYGLSSRFQIEWLRARPIFRKYDFAWSAIRWA